MIEPSDEIPGALADEMAARAAAAARGCRAVALCGTLPPGVGGGVYAAVAEACSERALVLVDGVKARPQPRAAWWTRDVSGQYGKRDETCPVSTERGTRRVQLAREGGGRGGGWRARDAGARGVVVVDWADPPRAEPARRVLRPEREPARSEEAYGAVGAPDGHAPGVARVDARAARRAPGGRREKLRTKVGWG